MRFLLEDEEKETDEEEKSFSRSSRGNSRILGSGKSRTLGGTPTRSSVEAMIEHGREIWTICPAGVPLKEDHSKAWRIRRNQEEPWMRECSSKRWK